MRVVIDLRCLADGRRTGVEEYVTGLLRALFDANETDEFVLFYNAWRGELPEDFGWMNAYPNVSVKRFHIPNKILNGLLWYFRWPKLDTFCGGADIFFMPNLNFAAVSQQAKLVVTAHDLSFEAYPETFSLKRRLWHLLVNFRGLCRRASLIVAVSHSTKQDIQSYYRIPDRKVVVTHSGLDQEFVRLSRNDPELLRVKEKYHLPYRYILYFGTFEPRKNIRAVVQAYEIYRHSIGERECVPLVLAGSPGWKSEEIFREIESSPYRSDIRLFGFIADEDKHALYNLATLFIYPSFYEGFGFPPLEAMACGVPTIVSRNSSFPEIVGEGAIMIDPYQPDELYRAMIAILSDHAFAEKLSREGERQTKKYTWERTADELSKMFRFVVGK
ncbi:MAG: glycosyltransferase family 1 protein [Candidatus Moraniibacteriota bacterium]